MITITLSAADATAHIIENPFARSWAPYRVSVTLALVAALGAVFVRGLREAVWLAVSIVAIYLVLNVVVVANGLWYICTHPETLTYWREGLFSQEPNYWIIVVAAILVFPRLALGLSGFETGVAVMPLVHGDGATPEELGNGRIDEHGEHHAKAHTPARRRQHANIIERPEGIRIAAWFIVTIVTTSLISRVMRSTELRAHGVRYDEAAERLLAEGAGEPLRIIANRPDSGLPEEYAAKLKEAQEAHHLPPDARVIFLEIYPGDASEFSSGALDLAARDIGGHQILSARSPAIPMPLRPSSWTCAIAPEQPPTPTSAGRRVIQSPMYCGSSRLEKAIRRP